MSPGKTASGAKTADHCLHHPIKFKLLSLPLAPKKWLSSDAVEITGLFKISRIEKWIKSNGSKLSKKYSDLNAANLARSAMTMASRLPNFKGIDW